MNNHHLTVNYYVISIILFLSLAGQNVHARQALDKIIAVVNDDVITQTELDNRVTDFTLQLKLNKNSKAEIQALTKQVLERMIITRIQLQKAKQIGITIDDISLNRMIEQIAKSNNLSLTKLKNTLAKDGVDFARFREQTREDVIIKKLQQRLVANKITISDQEIQVFIDTKLKKKNSNIKYKIQHILITTPEPVSPEKLTTAKKKAAKIYQNIKNGANFKTLAIQQSEGRNALKGGDLGWRSANELPEVFIKAISGLKKGETSAPIRSASGFHIIKLNDITSSNNMVTQTLARHILIRNSKNTSNNDARRLLKQLKKRILDGEDFSKLANEFSQDPGSKIKGGKLGWADPGSFVLEFEEVMNSLTNNAISEPFRSKFGWHILQVLDRRKQDKTKLNQHSQANRAIHKRKYDEQLRLWRRKIRDEAYVEYLGETAE